MRKITREIIHSFMHGITTKIDNSRTDGRSLWLFDNKIAEFREGVLWVTNAGWQSKTTKERLNGLSGVHINQIRGQWYLNGVAWDGEWVHVASHVASDVAEIEFDITSRWTDAGYSQPVYSVFHSLNESSLSPVEKSLNDSGILTKRMESDTDGVYRPNYFVVVRPDDVSKAVNILSELYCIA